MFKKNRHQPEQNWQQPVDPWPGGPSQAVPSPHPQDWAQELGGSDRHGLNLNSDYTRATALPDHVPPRERHPLTEPREVDFSDPEVQRTMRLARSLGNVAEVDTLRRAYKGRHFRDDDPES